jgi:uncharacterized protein YjbI with pentapeptide repeats
MPRALLPVERSLLGEHPPPGVARTIDDVEIVEEEWATVWAHHLGISRLVLTDTTWKKLECEGSTWSDCTIRGGSWSGGRFAQSRFHGCRFVECRLEFLRFENCHFHGCGFESCRMLDCTFINCRFDACTLVSVRANLRLQDCVIESTQAVGTHLTGHCDQLEWTGGALMLVSLTELHAQALHLRGARVEHLDVQGGSYGELVVRRCSGHSLSIEHASIRAMTISECESLMRLRLLGVSIDTLRLEQSSLDSPIMASTKVRELTANRVQLSDAHLQDVVLGGGQMMTSRLVGVVIEGGKFFGLSLPHTTIEGYILVRGGEFHGLDLQETAPPSEGLDVEIEGPIYLGHGDRWEVWSGT